MSKIIVTGASGFIGTHTCEDLVQDGYEVLALDLKPFPARIRDKLVKEGKHAMECHIFDLRNGNWGRYIDKGDKILHLGAVAHFVTAEDATHAVNVNVLGTLRLIKAAIKYGAERLVYASTGSVYAQPVEPPIREEHPLGPTADNYYGWSKLQAEHWIRNFGSQLPYLILRYAYVFGVRKPWGAIGNWLYNDLPKRRPPAIFGGRQSNDFIYIDDVVRANKLALNSPVVNQAYNIGTGRATTILEACKICINKWKSYHRDYDIEPEIQEARSFDYPAFFYNIQKARQILGFDPLWSVRSGIEDMLRDMPNIVPVAKKNGK